MDLQNGYKVIYEKVADGNRTFYASKNGLFAGAEVVTEAAIGEYKLVYEKDGKIYGSKTGVPATGDFCFEAFDKVFKKAEEESTTTTTTQEEPKTNSSRSSKKAEQVVEEIEEVVVEETEEETEVEE